MDWLPYVIERGILLVVTDGLYTQEHYLDLCSNDFILDCMHC